MALFTYIVENNPVILRFFSRVDKVTEEIWECKEPRELWYVARLELTISCLANNHFLQELFPLLEKF